MRKLKVIIGCEESGRVRDAFLKLGHEAMSCDLKPTRSPGPHYQGDIFDVIDYPWDLGIFHPECTHVAVSGARHFEAKRLDGRQQAAIAFVRRLDRATQHIPHTAFENPISILPRFWGPVDQIIQPWGFGHGETKATCLWLRNLPKLKNTNEVGGREQRIHRMAPSPDRAMLRSETYQGIADAIADQWSRWVVDGN